MYTCHDRGSSSDKVQNLDYYNREEPHSITGGAQNIYNILIKRKNFKLEGNAKDVPYSKREKKHSIKSKVPKTERFPYRKKKFNEKAKSRRENLHCSLER